jgi:hypothetical protein
MKKLIFFIAVMLVAQVSFTQIFSWGIKAGVNSTKISFDDFSIEDDITIKPDYLPGGPNADDLIITVDGQEVINPAAINRPGVKFEPKSYEMGYHFGAFARIKVLAIYIQPELYFSHTEAAIDFREEGAAGEVLESSATINYNNFDIPVLVGMKLGPARFNLGPVASFKLAPKVQDAQSQVENIESFSDATELATFGGQVGVGIDILKKVTLDIRYEFPLSKLGDQVTVGGNSFNTDQRQTQFMASIGWMF